MSLLDAAHGARRAYLPKTGISYASQVGWTRTKGKESKRQHILFSNVGAEMTDLRYLPKTKTRTNCDCATIFVNMKLFIEINKTRNGSVLV